MIKRLLYTLCFLLICAASLYPVPKEIEDALKLNRINHFDEALEIMKRALTDGKIKPDITSAYTVGRILYRKGEFYREAAKLAVLNNIEYFEHVREKEPVLPDEIKLFLGINYFFNKRRTSV